MRKFSCFAVFLAALAIVFSTPALARVELDAASLQTWADDVFGRALEERRFSGLGLVAVQDGRVVTTLTYGFEKWGAQIPIDPSRTQFRIGSASKTFTGTAIAQLWDRGEIESLDDPANRYLTRMQLPDWNGQEITVWDLLTHRGGFEDRLAGIATVEEVAVPVDGAIAEALMPNPVAPPGDRSVYCNYCTSVLGAMVEDITGQTLHDFLEANVFEPLGMTNTILGYNHEPTPDVGIPEIFYPNGENEPLRYVGIHPFISPAGNIHATLDDMARYMLAHLDAGRTATNPIMSPEAFDTMHAFKTRNLPSVSGFGMKFMVHDWNGERVVEHGGGWPGYFTSMTLFPNSDAAVFVSVFAGDAPADLWAMLLNALGFENRMTHKEGVPNEASLQTFRLHDMVLTELLGPYSREPAEPGADWPPLEEFVGLYRGERRDQTTATRLTDLLVGSSFKVELHEDGGLKIDGRGPYQQVEPDVFWYPDAIEGDFADHPGTYLYAFMRDDNGQITHLTGEISINPATPISAFESPEMAMQMMLLIILLCMIGLTALLWQLRGRGSKGLNLTIAGLGVCAIAMVVTMMDVLGPGRGYGPMPDLFLGYSGELVMLLVFTNLFAILALVAGFLTLRRWLERGWGSGFVSWVYRLQISLTTIAALAAIPFLWMHGGIGFTLP